MKKVFLFLSMVGLAFASCTTPDEGKTGGAGGAGEFEFEVTNIGEQYALVTVTAKEEGRTFHCNYDTKGAILSKGGTKAYLDAYYKDLKEAIDNGIVSLGTVLSVGSLEEGYMSDLKPNTTYYVWAFGIDMDGTLTSSDLSYHEFKTLPSTFDTTRWLGEWTLTPSKILVEMGISETQQWVQQFVPNQENSTYTLTITDSADFDPSWELPAGYAVITGWDANYPDYPMIGEYVANTLEFANDVVVDADPESGAVLLWTPLATNTTDDTDILPVGGLDWVIPYVFTMGEDGTISVEGFTDLATDTAQYIVEAYQLLILMDEYYYSTIKDPDVEIYHPGGNTMTAVKAVAEDNGDAGVAPAKLSVKKNNSKKNFRIMHKYANAKSAAFHFSSAIKFSKVRK